MSDFLSNFTNDHYHQDEEHQKTDVSQKMTDKPATKKEHANSSKIKKEVKKNDENSAVEKLAITTKTDDFLVKDSAFSRKKWIKRGIIGGISFLLGCCIIGFYYKQTHIKVPDFTGKTVTTAQVWADKHNVKLAVKRAYNMEKNVNTILNEPSKNKMISKKQSVVLTVSLGPNPKTKIKLPDFTKLSVDDARAFIKKEKLENTTVQLDYSETVAKGAYLKHEFTNKSVTTENFKREDNLTLFYANGKEPIVKNIEVPDFTKQTKAQIESWSKDKGVAITFKTAGSSTIEAEKVISQSIANGEKVSKADVVTVTMSLGKPVVVPDFSQVSFEESSTTGKTLPVIAKQVYSDTVPYGGFISQSQEAGTQYFTTDTIPDITVLFSIGRVYIKDMSGQTEGDLQATFYNEYRAKGAMITYQVQYVDSSEPKGVVVGQSALNDFVPLTYQVIMKISNGNPPK